MYPFTLEEHVLKAVSRLMRALATDEAECEACIRAHDDERERQRREALRRVAPGFEGGAVLTPVRVVDECKTT